MPVASFTEGQLLAAIGDGKTTQEVADALDVHRATAWRGLGKAQALGLVKVDGDVWTVKRGRKGKPKGAKPRAAKLAPKRVQAVEGKLLAIDTSPVADLRAPRPIDIALAGSSVDEIVAGLARVAEQLEHVNIDEAIETARAAEAASEVLKKCHSSIANAERGRRACEGLALQARRRVGSLLAELDGGSPGSKRSPRREAADAIELSRPDMDRTIKLAQLDEATVNKIAEQLDSGGERLTVRGVLRIAEQLERGNEGDGSDEWYTPPSFLDVLREFFGEIDCDPTSCLLAQRNVKARRWYSLRSPDEDAERAIAVGMTAEEIEDARKTWGGLGGTKDGKLTQQLGGSVFGQPPYSDPGPTIEAIVDGYADGRGLVREAVILVNVATSTEVQQLLLRKASAVLWVGKGEKHPRSRMAFVSPAGKAQAGNRYDQVAYFLGDRADEFAQAFEGWGVVTMRGRAAA